MNGDALKSSFIFLEAKILKVNENMRETQKKL